MYPRQEIVDRVELTAEANATASVIQQILNTTNLDFEGEFDLRQLLCINTENFKLVNKVITILGDFEIQSHSGKILAPVQTCYEMIILTLPALT